MKSIRRRTLTLIIGLLIGGLMTLSVLNLHDSNHEIAEVYDAQLAQNARLLQGIMRMPMHSSDHSELYRAFNEALGQASPKVDGHPYESKMAFQVWNLDGQLLVHTASAPSFTAPPSDAGFNNVVDLKNQQWRTFVLVDTEHSLRIWVGERDDVRNDLVNRIVRHTLGPNLIGSLLLATMIWFAIGWGLKPLANMATTLRARHPGSLEPIQLSPLPNELEPMQAALNRLLGQIQEVLGRERRFIADAAHELRTPLAVLRVHAQNLQEARNDAERQQSLHNLIAGVDRTSRLVNQLLTMARVEPRLGSAPLQPIDLTASVRDSLAQLTPWLLDRGLEVSLEAPETPLRILGDCATLDIALNNLVTNAANFSPKGGLITVRLEETASEVLLSVEDQGPGIDPEHRDRLFERFFSRGNDQGAGLGLAIVQTIAKRLGAKVSLDNLPQGGLCASVHFPLAHA